MQDNNSAILAGIDQNSPLPLKPALGALMVRLATSKILLQCAFWKWPGSFDHGL
jgi:hypothetical protein